VIERVGNESLVIESLVIESLVIESLVINIWRAFVHWTAKWLNVL